MQCSLPVKRKLLSAQVYRSHDDLAPLATTLTYLIYFALYAPREVMPMSSTTVLSPVYSDCDFAPAAANWLTYACVPIADLAALLLTALLSEAVCYLFFGRFAFTNYMRFAPCVLIFCAVFALAGLYPGFPINPIEEFRLTLRAVGLSFLIITGGTFLMGSSPLLCLILVIFAWLLASVLVPLSRHVARLWCSRQPWWGIPTVILGERAAGMRILSVLQANRHFGLRPIAILFDPLVPDGVGRYPQQCVLWRTLTLGDLFPQSS